MFKIKHRRFSKITLYIHAKSAKQRPQPEREVREDTQIYPGPHIYATVAASLTNAENC